VQLINFLIGIARRRHHSQVRNNPRAMFFYGVTRHQKVDGRSLPQLVRSFHRRNAQPADPIRIFKNWPLRYWTQAFLGYLDEAAAESNHKFADL
jgi:hypothetical protein